MEALKLDKKLGSKIAVAKFTKRLFCIVLLFGPLTNFRKGIQATWLTKFGIKDSKTFNCTMDSVHLRDKVVFMFPCQFISVHVCNCQGLGIGVPGVSSKSWRYLAAWLNLYKLSCSRMLCHVMTVYSGEVRGWTPSKPSVIPAFHIASGAETVLGLNKV